MSYKVWNKTNSSWSFRVWFSLVFFSNQQTQTAKLFFAVSVIKTRFFISLEKYYSFFSVNLKSKIYSLFCWNIARSCDKFLLFDICLDIRLPVDTRLLVFLEIFFESLLGPPENEFLKLPLVSYPILLWPSCTVVSQKKIMEMAKFEIYSIWPGNVAKIWGGHATV